MTKHAEQGKNQGMAHSCQSAHKEELSMWENTKEGAARVWGKTKEVSGDVWETTKEGAAKAWDKTKELGSDISEKFSGEEKDKHGIYEFDETDEFDIEEPMSDYEDEELRTFHAAHHYEKNKSHGTAPHIKN